MNQKSKKLLLITIVLSVIAICFSSCDIQSLIGKLKPGGDPGSVVTSAVDDSSKKEESGNSTENTTLYVRRFMPTPLETTTAEPTTEEPTTEEPTTKKPKPTPPTTEEPATVPTTTEKPTEREATTKRQEPTTRKQEPTTQWEPVTQHPARSDLREVVLEVIRGNYGNGAERKRRLEADGYDFEEVQNEVNRVMGYIEQEVESTTHD